MRHLILIFALLFLTAACAPPTFGGLAAPQSGRVVDRIVARVDRHRDTTTFDYDGQTVSRVARRMGSNSPIATSFCAAEATSLALCAPDLRAPTAVVTRINGPRTDTAVTQFHLTRYGSPWRVVDALNDITTIEGLGTPDQLNALQSEFREKHGLQCGFCTPGMLMTGMDLLKKYPLASDEEIREGLSGNLCRCTGYQNIVAAIRSIVALRNGSTP
jgi:hypothetical protein